ncbi:hypothetical protein CEXT_592621 [Caerostris extrusa]|uniref:Uncharacterized protein n=1 Tax=Caerostris extrusa TaxID=172846 RepID=A0AAV4Y6R9_CAEEX|nr:hypothetical protein CEXT_592621 [Caerostris extrusa]
MFISQFGDTFREMSLLVQNGQMDAKNVALKRDCEMGGLKNVTGGDGEKHSVCVIGKKSDSLDIGERNERWRKGYLGPPPHPHTLPKHHPDIHFPRKKRKKRAEVIERSFSKENESLHFVSEQKYVHFTVWRCISRNVNSRSKWSDGCGLPRMSPEKGLWNWQLKNVTGGDAAALTFPLAALLEKPALWTSENKRWAKGLILYPSLPHTILKTPPRHSFQIKKKEKRPEVIGRSPSKRKMSVFSFRGQNRNMCISQFGDTFQEMSFLVQTGRMDAACRECRQKRDCEMGGLKMSLEEIEKNTACVELEGWLLFFLFRCWAFRC